MVYSLERRLSALRFRMQRSKSRRSTRSAATPKTAPKVAPSMVRDRFLNMLVGGGGVDDGEASAVTLDAGDIDEGVESGVVGFEAPKN